MTSHSIVERYYKFMFSSMNIIKIVYLFVQKGYKGAWEIVTQCELLKMDKLNRRMGKSKFHMGTLSKKLMGL